MSGTVTWFAKFRKDEEYLDGKFPTAPVYSQTELKEMRKEQFKKDSNKTREQLMEEAQNEQEVEPIPTSLPQPEWIDAMTEGTGTGASSSGDHQGASPAEQATVPEPIPVKNSRSCSPMRTILMSGTRRGKESITIDSEKSQSFGPSGTRK